MPVYEYRCSKGHTYERTEGFNAPTRQRCQQCGAVSRRLISMPAVIFRGSGFYSTDNRRGSAGLTSAPSESGGESSNGHGHSHSDGGHSHGADGGHSDASSEPKVAATADD